MVLCHKQEKKNILPVCVTERDCQIILNKNSFQKHNTNSKNLIP